MGVEPPFIYDKPTNYTFAGPTARGFNPRAATQASWTPPAPKPKRDGPLIDFNKHPDSYLIVPYGHLNVEPMNPKTKVRVKRARGLQLFLRVCALFGALGSLFCIVSINKTTTSVGWIIRVGPAVALCHSVYAIYHLCRGAASRSPASTASYMLFAGMLDTGLVPFFGFSAIMAKTDYTNNTYGWSTLFNNDQISYKIIYAFFLLCVTECAMFLVSLCLDIYLAVVFRKIAKMPPDMNPLEDNLTARPNGKHKRNKSEMVFEKHLSGSTLATQRMSHMSQSSLLGNKRVPFTHTRTDSADRITLYGNDQAFNSRASLRKDIDAAGDDPYRSSMASSRDTLIPSRPTSAVTPAANNRSPGTGLSHKPVRSSGLAQESTNGQTNSWLSYTDYEGVPSVLSDTANRQLDEEVRPLSPVSIMSDHDLSPARSRDERQNWYQASPRQSQSQVPVQQEDIGHRNFDHDQLVPSPSYALQGQSKKRSRDPLAMNPPTPVRDQFQDENLGQWSDLLQTQTFSTPQRQALHDVQANSAGRPSMGSRPSSFVGSGGKSRYYGNLRSSLAGSPTRSPTRDAHQADDHDDDESDYSRTRTMESEDSGNFRVYDSDEDDRNEHDHNNHNLEPLDRTTHAIMLGQTPPTEPWNDIRKVSNSTGYDLKTGYAGLGAEFGLGMARRREVSGKVAEEGRGHPAGYGHIGRTESKDGAVITGQGLRGGAAGWERFKGL